ncbi:MAG TPA: PP2C family protein-serine/threonine phosphatase [Tepidisphaeraceae bacterium]|jgi:sigma-B regulation protein RsbU (phosphoserine phosphatase)|nr:PP2C family protein-serine/threonine phosphatase [Tepidisphaeraceae bacterium]
MPESPAPISFPQLPWEQRLDFIVDMMREMSSNTDPQQMVQAYIRKIRVLIPSDRWMALSRRDLQSPQFRITRSDLWDSPVNPWKDRNALPLLSSGLCSELIYAEQPRIINDLQIADDDPAKEYFHGMRSLQAVPQFDRGQSLNMVISMRREPNGFDPQRLPELVWVANLFGRATHNLVLSEEVKRAYEVVDRELKVVSDIQLSLLPEKLPRIPTLEIAAHYQTSQRAGGDYYDFFALPDGRWGILIADVSGHGTPAAVLMAVTHSIAHTHNGDPDPPSKLMRFINEHLAARYTNGTGTFVTAFYGIYDPKNRTIIYSRAGHCPPRIKRCSAGKIESMDAAPSLPLGIDGDEKYIDMTETLLPGDVVVFYTDGIIESRERSGELFGVERLDEIIDQCSSDPETIIRRTLLAIEDFTNDAPPLDDLTMLIAKVK